MFLTLRSLFPGRRRGQNARHTQARCTAPARPSLERLEDRCLPQATPGTVVFSSQDTLFLTQAVQFNVQAASLGALAVSVSTNSQTQTLGSMVFVQSVENLVQLTPLLQAGGVSFPVLTSQQVFLTTSLTNLGSPVFDQQLLATLALTNIVAQQQALTEINSGTNVQLRAVTSVQLNQLQLLQSLTLAVGLSEFFPSTLVGVTAPVSIGLVGTGATNGFATIGNGGLPIATNNLGYITINNGGLPIATDNLGYNTINNGGLPPA